MVRFDPIALTIGNAIDLRRIDYRHRMGVDGCSLYTWLCLLYTWLRIEQYQYSVGLDVRHRSDRASTVQFREPKLRHCSYQIAARVGLFVAHSARSDALVDAVRFEYVEYAYGSSVWLRTDVGW